MSTCNSGISQRIDPAVYYREFIKNGVRIDGRSFSDLRCVAVGGNDFSCSSECGSSLVHFGNTKVACSISVLVGTPSQLDPSSGDIGTRCFSVGRGLTRYHECLKTSVYLKSTSYIRQYLMWACGRSVISSMINGASLTRHFCWSKFFMISL